MRLLVPEVVQTSNMDCGPAALKCLLEGFGIPVHYGRLREACQTDVDGTSIDTIEEVANQLGLEAEQIMIPSDHVLLDSARALPAIAVVVLPKGITHFVVIWKRHGRFVQLMDPATGRRWVDGERFLRELFMHRMQVAAEDWKAYAVSESLLAPLRERLRNLGIPLEEAQQRIQEAVADAGWNKIAALDAAARMTGMLVRSGAVEPRGPAARILAAFLKDDALIPEQYWSVRPASEPDQLVLRGAVLVRAVGRSEKRAPRPSSPELAAALRQPAIQPGHELLRLLREDGIFTPALLVLALALASGAVILEAVLFRGLLNAAGGVGSIVTLLLFSGTLLLFEIPLTGNVLRMGRHLETRLRLAFLRKIPRLGDRYFQSRLKSDMAERSHSIHLIRRLPDLGGQLLRYSFEIVFTTAGIVWLDPASAPIAVLAAAAAIATPLIAQPALLERDLRLRTHAGALSHFYLDALLGLVAIHSHGAQPAVRREHENLLAEWKRAGFNLQRTVISLETVQFLLGFGLAIWLLVSHLSRAGESGAILLLVYWALNLPALGQEIALLAWQYPMYRNVTLRLLEPLGALEQSSPQRAGPSFGDGGAGVALAFENAGVVVSGHKVLEEISLAVAPGEHVAIVGPSGAGKSSLVGILLGWHRPSEGCVRVDGIELDEAAVTELRPHIAWVDPAVQLWNRPLADNLRYGIDQAAPVDEAVQTADLGRVLERLPDGMRTLLGESGGLVSGGEGQRVRLARALLRPGVRLAILDEPFRGLDISQRHTLLERARSHWKKATLLHISHDIAETLSFDRVLVVENGRIVEDGRPGELEQQQDSRFRALLDAERAVREGLWSSTEWRHLKLVEGAVVES